jgi:predicted MFS family arabinose efflux permease
MYSGINAVGRPIAGIALERLSLRQATYAGLGLQTIVLFSMPFLSDLSAILVAFLAAGTGRSVVVVANSIGLVEEVDDSRVSRGVATSAYNAAADVSHITAPLAAGGLAAALGTGAMFSIVAACALTFFALGDGAVRGWRRRLRPPPPVASVR